MKHENPYRVNDPDNIFEVSENSSHPELDDARRIYRFGGYTFETATALQKFFESEGLDPRRYAIEPRAHREFAKNLIVIDIKPKGMTRNSRALKELSFG